MLSEFLLPALGADMEEGTVVQWHVAPGDVVRRGEVWWVERPGAGHRP